MTEITFRFFPQSVRLAWQDENFDPEGQAGQEHGAQLPHTGMIYSWVSKSGNLTSQLYRDSNSRPYIHCTVASINVKL